MCIKSGTFFYSSSSLSSSSNRKYILYNMQVFKSRTENKFTEEIFTGFRSRENFCSTFGKIEITIHTLFTWYTPTFIDSFQYIIYYTCAHQPFSNALHRCSTTINYYLDYTKIFLNCVQSAFVQCVFSFKYCIVFQTIKIIDYHFIFIFYFNFFF